MSFSVVSTFAGCGGSSTGYVWAGGKVLLAVEWDANAVETYRLNYPNTPIYHGDIAKLSVEEALRLTGLKQGELDVFDGSPPCQGFSTAGKRNMGDDRNQLFREYVRLLKGFMPKVFVMENVSGMVKGNMKFVFVEILKELKAAGYNVKVRLLNAKYYEVPQSRERMIFIGVRNDLGIEPTHPKAVSLKPITVREAIGGLSLEMDESMGHFWNDDSHTSTYTKALKAKEGEKYAGFQCRIQANKPSPTLTKPGIGKPYLRNMNCHYEQTRTLSALEYKRLASFPDDYKFAGKWEIYDRIGNSVPPKFMYHIAKHINETILHKIAEPDINI